MNREEGLDTPRPLDENLAACASGQRGMGANPVKTKSLSITGTWQP